MSRPVAIICTLLVGALVAMQPPANASLSRYVGDFGAAFVSIMISAVIIGALLVTVGHPGRLSAIGSIKPEHVLGGVAGAAIVLVSLAAVRPLGAAALVALLVTAQLLGGVAADRFGWFGLHQVGLSAGRVVGVALAIAGTILVTRT